MKILIADNQPSARLALCALLEQQNGWIVVGEVGSVNDLSVKIEETNPNLVLLDWTMLLSIEEGALRDLLDKQTNLSVIVMSGRPENRSEALALGVDDFVSKTEAPDKLLGAISCVYQIHNNLTE